MAVGSGGAGGSAGAIRAGRAFVELSTRDAGLRSGLANARRMLLGWSKGLAIGGAGLIGLGTSILGPLLASFRAATSRMTELYDAGQRLGASTEDLSALGYAATKTGASFDDMATAAKMMQDKLINSPEAFDKLGISSAKMMKLGLADQFQEIANSINKMDKEAKTAAARELMGRGGPKLIAMLKELEKLRRRSKLIGANVSQKDADDADRVADALEDVWFSLKYTFQAIGASLLAGVETIEAWTEAILHVIKPIREWIERNRVLVLGVAAVAAGVALLGVALVALGSAFAFIAFAASGFVAVGTAVAAVAAAILSPLGLTIIAIAAFGAGLAAVTIVVLDALGTFDGWGKVIDGLLETFNTAWQGIKDALKAGDLSLAFNIAVAGLDVIWKGFLVGLQIAWNDFKDFFVGGWHSAIMLIRVEFAEMLGWMKRQLEAAGVGDIGNGLFGGIIQGMLGPLNRGSDPDAIVKQFGKDQEARAAANAAGLAAAVAGLKMAQAVLDALVGQAARLAGAAKPDPKKQAGAISATFGLTRGAFAGRGIGAELGVVGGSIEKQQLDALERIDDGVQAMIDKVGGLAVA